VFGGVGARSQSEMPSTPRSGADLYKQFCASCHGADLKGNVPAPPPPPPYRKPPDLTTLSKRHKGKFPDGYVTNVLKNGVIMPAHGPAQMPIWGTDFKTVEVTILKNYIKSFQVK
jgi:mono/diheme cytochrome c family protein